MTTQQVADRYYELAQMGQFDQIIDEFFVANTCSIEPENAEGMTSAYSLEEIKAKNLAFSEVIEEMHGGYTNAPIVSENHFAVVMGMDVTMKGQGRVKMEEIVVCEVRDGKIVREQYFY